MHDQTKSTMYYLLFPIKHNTPLFSAMPQFSSLQTLLRMLNVPLFGTHPQKKIPILFTQLERTCFTALSIPFASKTDGKGLFHATKCPVGKALPQ